MFSLLASVVIFVSLSHIFEIPFGVKLGLIYTYASSPSAAKVAWFLDLCCDLCRFATRDTMRISVSLQDCNILRDDKWRAIRFYVASNWNDDLITWYVCIANAKCLQFVFRNWRRLDYDLHFECFVQQRLFLKLL